MTSTSTTMLCLETNFLIDYLDPEQPGHEDALAFLERRSGPFFVPSFCLFEVYRGPARQQDPDGLARTADALDWGFRLPFTPAAAREAAEIELEQYDAGEPLDVRDYPVAGTVRNAGGTLVTADERFGAISGLNVVRY